MLSENSKEGQVSFVKIVPPYIRVFYPFNNFIIVFCHFYLYYSTEFLRRGIWSLDAYAAVHACPTRRKRKETRSHYRFRSLAKNKTINLNQNLLKAPEEVIDYIIIHELCHLKIKGHSHKFWDYLHKFVPDYEDHINWLAINGSNMLG